MLPLVCAWCVLKGQFKTLDFAPLDFTTLDSTPLILRRWTL